MNNERMIAVSSGLIERAISLLDLLPESGTIIELRAALATQPAAGAPVAPGVNYVDEVDLIRAVLEGYPPSIARTDALCSVKLLKAYFAAPPAAAHGHTPSVSGIGRDAGHPRALVLYLRSEPTDDDIRAIQEALRSNAAAHGDEALESAQNDLARTMAWVEKFKGMFGSILLKKSLCAFRPRKWTAYVEIRTIAGTELLQISHSSVPIEHFSGFRQVGRDGTDFFNRIVR